MENLKELKRRKKEIRKERNKLNKEESKINNAIEKQETIPKMKKNIGKCYKYRNSGGGVDSEWWLYTKITGIKNSCYTTASFQHPKGEYIEYIMIETEKHVSPSRFEGSDYPSNHIEITEEEYNKAREKILKEIEEVI